MPRFITALLIMAGLAACTNANDLDRAPVDMGDFRLGHNIVVAPKMQKGPLSREASEEEWAEALTDAIAERFDRYEGDRLYHFGVSVEGYVLAQPGVPVVLSPKSVLIIRLTVWDDAAEKKLNAEPKQITIMETLSGDTMVGSGLTQTKQEQMSNLSRNAAKQIQTYLVRMMNAEGWFVPEEAAAPGDETDAQPAQDAEETPDEGDGDTAASAPPADAD
jgi:hypothetical protein